MANGDGATSTLLTPDNFPPEVRSFLGRITAIEAPAKQGMTSQVVFVQAAPGSVAIKRSRGRHVDALRREHAVLAALAPLDLPVPAPLLITERAGEQGIESWLTMRRLPGMPVLQALRAGGPAEHGAALLRHLGMTLAQLHATEVPPALGLPGENWLEYMLQQAATNLAAGIGQGDKTRLAELRRDRPWPVAPVLIHGDLFLDNALALGERVTGLID